jgi:hypothetical protein
MNTTTRRHVVLSNKDEIVRFLDMNLCPPTDNLEVLRDLGFAREFPNEKKGGKALLWIRHVDRGYSGQTLKRSIRKQRARLTYVAT